MRRGLQREARGAAEVRRGERGLINEDGAERLSCRASVQNSRPAPAARMRVVVRVDHNDA